MRAVETKIRAFAGFETTAAPKTKVSNILFEDECIDGIRQYITKSLGIRIIHHYSPTFLSNVNGTGNFKATEIKRVWREALKTEKTSQVFSKWATMLMRTGGDGAYLRILGVALALAANNVAIPAIIKQFATKALYSLFTKIKHPRSVGAKPKPSVLEQQLRVAARSLKISLSATAIKKFMAEPKQKLPTAKPVKPTNTKPASGKPKPSLPLETVQNKIVVDGAKMVMTYADRTGVPEYVYPADIGQEVEETDRRLSRKAGFKGPFMHDVVYLSTKGFLLFDKIMQQVEKQHGLQRVFIKNFGIQSSGGLRAIARAIYYKNKGRGNVSFSIRKAYEEYYKKHGGGSGNAYNNRWK